MECSAFRENMVSSDCGKMEAAGSTDAGLWAKPALRYFLMESGEMLMGLNLPSIIAIAAWRLMPRLFLALQFQLGQLCSNPLNFPYSWRAPRPILLLRQNHCVILQMFF